MMTLQTVRLWFVAAGLATSCLAGCATFNLPWDKNRVPKATAKNPVVKIVCLWEQAEGRDPDGLPCRGFAGQVLFLANRNAMPVQVQGDVRIYLFDNIGTQEDQAKPLRQFDFTSDVWQIHLTKSAIGPSYSVFVPYVRRGQQNAQCSLRVRLTPNDGPTIFSDVASLTLRGPDETAETTVITNPSITELTPLSPSSLTAREAKKATTIPLMRSNPSDMALSPPHAAPWSTSSAVDDRLDRMERLLEHALAERRSPPPAATSTGIEQAGYQTESVSDDSPPLRFRLSQSPP